MHSMRERERERKCINNRNKRMKFGNIINETNKCTLSIIRVICQPSNISFVIDVARYAYVCICVESFILSRINIAFWCGIANTLIVRAFQNESIYLWPCLLNVCKFTNVYAVHSHDIYFMPLFFLSTTTFHHISLYCMHTFTRTHTTTSMHFFFSRPFVIARTHTHICLKCIGNAIIGIFVEK